VKKKKWRNSKQKWLRACRECVTKKKSKRREKVKGKEKKKK